LVNKGGVCKEGVIGASAFFTTSVFAGAKACGEAAENEDGVLVADIILLAVRGKRSMG
jgi:hypothetical protein